MRQLINKIYKAVTHPIQTIDYIRCRYAAGSINPEELCDSLYTLKFNRKINWDNPDDLNQWIAWLQFKTDTSLWGTLADKYRMHDYLKEKGFGENLVPIIAKWESADEIDITNLPNSFVLKCNNGSGDVMIIKEKSRANTLEIKEYFRKQMSRDFGRTSSEPHYQRIRPLIIAETFLDTKLQSTESSSLIDYKFWCFNGKVDRIFVCMNRTKQHFTVDLYNTQWQQIAEGNLIFDKHHLQAKTKLAKPVNFDKMMSIASEISHGFPQMRIDFYEVDNKVYIGELTLTSQAGRMDYFTDECLIDMGNHCRNSVRELTQNGLLNLI